MKRAALLLAVAVLATDAHAKCAMQVLDHAVVTHPGDEIPAGGGVLDAWLQHSYDGTDRDRTADPTVHATWKFREKKKLVLANAVTLAPGLTVYIPKVKRGKKHTVTLLDGTTTKKTYTIAKKGRVLLPDAPPMTAAVRSEHQDRRSHSIKVEVTLGTAPPADAYGLIAYNGDVAVSWQAVEDPAATTMFAYKSPGRCGVEPETMEAPSEGDSLTFAWVDKFGQLSPRSSAVTVTK